MKPRIVGNSLPQIARFDTAGVAGTGTTSQTLEENGLVPVTTMASGSAGRSNIGQGITLVANQWYCASFEVTEQDLTGGGANVGFKFTSAPDNGSTVIDAAKILAGGVGRYACIFMDTTGGAFSYVVGVGLSSNASNVSMTIKNVMFEPISLGSGAYPSEYVYPGSSKAAFNTPINSGIDSNNKVTSSNGSAFDVDIGSVLLLCGDSRADGADELGQIMKFTLGDKGHCMVHSRGFWKTTDVLGPFTVFTDYILTFDKALSGELLHFGETSDTVDVVYGNRGIDPSVAILLNLGINDILAGNATDTRTLEALAAMRTMVDKAIAAGIKPCLTELTPWNAFAGFVETEGDLPQTHAYNRGLKYLAEEKDCIFVPLYKAMGDSTDEDKLSDGLGTTPDYSVDGAHINAAGSRVIAGLILNEIQIYAQSQLG